MIIAAAALKGGVGKTTCCLHLAGIYKEMGYDVLVVDADEQGSAQAFSTIAQDFPTVVSITQPILHKPEQVQRLAESFDIVIIDGPPKSAEVTRSMLMIPYVICVSPISPGPQDLWSFAQFKKLVEDAQTINRTLTPLLLISRRKPNTSIGEQARDSLTVFKGFPALDTEIYERVIVQESLLDGQTINQFDRRRDSKSFLEFQALAQEILSYAQSKANAQGSGAADRR